MHLCEEKCPGGPGPRHLILGPRRARHLGSKNDIPYFNAYNARYTRIYKLRPTLRVIGYPGACYVNSILDIVQ